ncbi:MAG: glycosyltransferase family 39 protein [Candidatus Binatia bacterium]
MSPPDGRSRCARPGEPPHGCRSGNAGPPLKGYGSALAGAVIAGVLLLSGLIAIPAIGDRTPFYTRGEPREALVVQTIVSGGGIILPMRNGDELPSKPPLFHWLGALASVAYGRITEGTIRFPGLVASLVAVAATSAAAWAWWGPATAVLTSVILATSFQWLASSVSARVDIVLAAAITLALLLFARAIETGRRIPAAAYALMAVATLTKGPIGLVLPCTIALVTLLLRGELRFLGLRDLRLLALWSGVAGLWYAAASFVGGQDFIDKQILKENVFRVLDAEAVGAGHVEAFWYYVPLLAAGLAPWSLFVPGLAIVAWSRRKAQTPQGPQTPQDPHAPQAAQAAQTPQDPAGPAEPSPAATTDAGGETATAVSPRADSPHRLDRHALFALVWGGVTFLLFSAAGSKRAVYLLPAYPAYAMLLALAWTRVFARRPARAGALALAVGAAASALVLAVAGVVLLAGTAGFALDGWLEGLVSDADVNNVAPMLSAMKEHRMVALPCCVAMVGAAWITLQSLGRGRWERVVASTVVAMFALSATVSTTLLPALASKRSTRSFLARVEQQVPVTTPLSFYRAFDYGAVFYRRAPIPLRSTLADVPEIDGAWLLTWPAFLPALAEEARKLDTGSEAAGAYEVEEAIASKDVDPSDTTSLILVRIVRRFGDEHSDGN